MTMSLRPVILSGGSGTRLWPYSREAYPKQFLVFSGERTLLQDTATRIEGVGGGFSVAAPLVICNESHRFLVAEQLRQIQLEGCPIMLEPVGRNTAPALTLAALYETSAERDPVLLVMPSDHHVRDAVAFRERVYEAAELAAAGKVVTFGIVPTHPETGFGYIRRGRALSGSACTLEGFVEKPDAARAAEYIATGNYLWNSGLFILKASVWIRLVERFAPAILQACRDALGETKQDGDFVRVGTAPFQACPSDSIDYAVMEHIAGGESAEAAVIPLDVGWSDLGSWPALLELRTQDAHGNVTHGDVFLHDTENSLVYAQQRFVAALGLKDVMVVETSDAVLVAHKDQAQEVRSIIQHLKQAGRSEHIFHSKVHRPWGDYESIDSGHRYQVKRLTVKPGATLSLQLHHHRAEHWIVVRGTARVTRNDETFLLTENESTYIPLGVKHRLENPGAIPLEMIEVQSGTYLGEDDIVRFEDKYNRLESRN